MKNIFKYILFTAAFFVLILNPETASRAVINSMRISVSRIIPSIFPFMVLSELIIYTFENRFSKSKSSKIAVIPLILLGNASGFPVGAKNTGKLHEKGIISEKQAVVCAILSGNASISFAVSFVGANLFLSKKTGLIIYLCQLCASIISAIFCALILKERKSQKERQLIGENRKITFEEAFINSVSSTSTSCLTVTAFITVFGIIIEYVDLVCNKLSLSPCFIALISSFLEISNGCFQSVSLPSTLSYVICAFAVGFSGLSVMFQSMSFLSKVEIRCLPFIAFKLLQGCLSSLIAYFMTKYFPLSLETSHVINEIPSEKRMLSILLIAVCALYLLIILKKITLKKERT